MRVRLRAAVPADLAHFAAGQKVPCRVRAIAAVADQADGTERLLGLGGFGYRPEAVVAFAFINDEGRRYPAAIHRAGRAAMRMIVATGVPVVIAEPEDGNAAAVAWLLRLGFVNDNGAYVWRRGDYVE